MKMLFLDVIHLNKAFFPLSSPLITPVHHKNEKGCPKQFINEVMDSFLEETQKETFCSYPLFSDTDREGITVKQ